MTAKVQDGAGRRVRAGICVIGAGNWGSSLAAAVAAAELPLIEVAGRRPSSRRFGKLIVTSFRRAALDAEMLWICVPDGKIASVAGAIAARRGDLRGQVVLHSSGAVSVGALDAAKRAGARVGSVAPVFSFPAREPVSLAGVLFAVESAAGLSRKLSSLVKKLGGRPFLISAEKKVLYHAAATMASPLVVSALDAAVRTAGLAGLGSEEARAVVEVLAATTLRNYFENGSERSFSGAFARGDVETVELHLRALLAHPTLSVVYRALAGNAVESLPVRNGAAFKRVLDAGSWSGKRGVRD